jgi:cytochrome c
MYKVAVSVALLFMLVGCQESKPQKNYDGKRLLNAKCSSCHNLDLPPTLSDKELAPPMMAVAHHIFHMVDVEDESQRALKSVEFVKDYVVAPAVEKSFCDKASLKTYGLMPSQKGKVTQDELEAIATYMFKHYTQKNLSKAQSALNKFNAMPKGERIARKNNCFGCHRVDMDLVGPSFKNIAKKYKDAPQTIVKSIKEGSRGKWSSTKVMPAFKKLDDKRVEILKEWIIKH